MTATVEQVKALLPEGTDLGDPQIQALITQAETYLYARVPDLDRRIACGQVTQATVDFIEASMVARVARNPDGYRAETEGDYSYQLDSRAAAGFLTLLPDELIMLGIGRGAFTIAPANPPRRRHRHLPGPVWPPDWWRG
ncbi:Gp19/Gp15/Gp42 family protein [Streptomyces indicus]|uniref:Phage protein Gp19/Gp15/Gp42 n=1 Tax=Streptomyces indicus TaxID=417292 RepID=A0A1G8W8F2_9ACTN|nr:Gp19/Gp15/Gp42 family protein [Streptomyces indicus]SDJ74558.1 Phage protein Gp19/Gp15/Gp42 [Streptomyces indicus]